MGYLPSIRSRAAHFVSDLTTVLLNPISDHPSKPHDEVGMRIPEKEVADECSASPDGPDTSSFTAFLYSFLSSSDSGGHSGELNESTGEIGEKASTSGIKENVGRKGLLSRGKQSLGRAFHKAARLTGYRQNSDPKVDSNVPSDLKIVGHELRPMEVANETVAKFNLPESSEPSMLLSENMRSTLYVSLPALVQGRKWVLLYSTWRHGISLSTLYRRSMLWPGYSLLVVGDQKGAVFGGLVEAPLRPTNKRKYQGTNHSFVFTYLSNQLVIFRPTGANHYFTLCSTDFLALGGGGHFALYLDGDLLNGSSSSSDTFGNSCLAHSQDFVVKEVELWGFVYASKYDELVDFCRTERPGICRW